MGEGFVRIILGREFLSAGMKSARGNHPCERIFVRRDEISIAKWSAFWELPLGEISNPTTSRIDPKKYPNARACVADSGIRI